MRGYQAADVVDMDEAGTDDTEDYAYGWCHHTQHFEAGKLGQGHQTLNQFDHLWDAVDNAFKELS